MLERSQNWCRLSAGFLCFVVASNSDVAAQAPLPGRHAVSEADWTAGELFEAVVQAIGTSYHDRDFRQQTWPELASRYAEAARTANSRDEERAVVDALLGSIPNSHVALYSKPTYDHLLAELSARDAPTFGLELEQRAGRFFATGVLEGGPAERAGVRRGDRVLAIDGVVAGASPRLDRRSDDAHLPDPPRHGLLGEVDDTVELTLQDAPDATPRTVTVRCQEYSAWRAAQASVATCEVDGRRVGYVHYWFVHLGGVHGHFRELLRGAFADCDACVLDLRGRGGDAAAVAPLLAAVRAAGRPIVALVDAGTRSAKEVIAYRLQREGLATLVGEHTARAVIPATFRRVGAADVLMFPTFTLGEFTTAIEGIGVAPDVEQVDRLVYAHGDDPILGAGLRVAANSVRRGAQRAR
ncbi:MAG: S41 family peptidase [Planctomycetota bacterium]